MKTVKISSKYQMVIPQEVRENMDLKPGQKIELIPYRKVSVMCDFLKGINPEYDRKVHRL
mgnify:CR=1 FL=1